MDELVLAARPPMTLGQEVVAAAAEPPAAVEPQTIPPAVADVVPPVAAGPVSEATVSEAVVAAPVAPPTPTQVERSGWVAKRLQELEAKAARGEVPTVGQQDWRQLAQQQQQVAVGAPAA